MEDALILAIETSGKTGGIALFQNKLLGSISLISFQSYSKILFKTLPYLLELLQIPLEKIDYYAIDIGPGSFTGLRIGFSVLKALNMVHPRPVIGISSLEVLTMNYFKSDVPLACLIDAYTKEVFFANYKWEEDKLEVLYPPKCIPYEEIPQIIKEKTLFLSENLEKWDKYLEKNLNTFYIKPKIPCDLNPAKLAKLAYLKLKKHSVEFQKAEDILPFYLKASEAERKFSKIK